MKILMLKKSWWRVVLNNKYGIIIIVVARTVSNVINVIKRMRIA